MERPKIDFKKVITKFLGSLLAIGILILIIYLIFRQLGYTELTQEQLQDFITNTGIWGPLVFVLISFLQVTIVPIPGAITIIAGSQLFGFWLSYLLSFIGMFLGALFAFFLGRIIGRPFVNWIMGDKETVDYYLKKIKGKEIVILFFMFLLPVFPDDALCALAGITKISWPVFIVMQFITRITSIGGTLIFMSGKIIPYHGWGLVVLIIIGILSIVAFIIAYKNADKINDKIDSLLDRKRKK